MSVAKKMKALFPGWAIGELDDMVKTHVPQLTSNEIVGLSDIARSNEVTVIRSGSGLTIIAEKKPRT